MAARHPGLERIKEFAFKHFERVLVIVLVVSLLAIHYFIDYKLAFLSFYYLPIIGAGFFLGRNTAVLSSVLVVALVLFFQATQGLGGAAGFASEEMFTIVPWAGFLVLTGYIVGGLADQRQARAEDLKRAYVALLEIVTFDLESGEKHQRGHSHRVATIATELGRELGLSKEELDNLRVAALLHEVGPRDPRLIRLLSHFPGTVTGLPLASAVRGATDVLEEFSRYYEAVDHEWPIDELGFTPAVKILAVVDAFETLQMPTPHRPAFARWTAIEEIEKGRGRTFSGDVVKALKKTAGRPHDAQSGMRPPVLKVENF